MLSQVITKTTGQPDILPHVRHVHHLTFACDLNLQSFLQTYNLSLQMK